MRYRLKYKPYAEDAILIEWPPEIDENILQDILIFQEKIKTQYNKVIIEVVSAYNSLLVYYLSAIEDFYDKISGLKALYNSNTVPLQKKQKVWKLPVCYSPHLAPDLISFSKTKALSIDDIISLHTAPQYTVYFLGFLPGFLYLGGLPQTLHFIRKKTPAPIVERGAVAIGGNQTGIYPVDSPGGWHVIGKCPLNLFDAHQEIPSRVCPSDRVQFVSISASQYTEIRTKVLNKNYFPEPEELSWGK
ncbi:5-oxoprolinase subunit PxpB [Aquimarina sp. U1-2]|uniref:5-oxoprolinase subunit PxpB n=1 Tax=Aquimarina sp. U1-2 TaxID=2823141 RepID=UPI001AECD2B0|nr:5-oxoprolinase subunit PxpB [Aquimarina sp. U1-2]MBP2833632.1 5-oxoprolinase subunit PxpB [Aquimarina sp. U1-2]